MTTQSKKDALAAASRAGNRKPGTKPSNPAKKSTAKKSDVKTTKKDVAASSAKVLAPNKKAIASQANAEKSAQPGIIASIMNILGEAKKAKQMYTVEEIVTALTVLFPDRDPIGMTTTVRAQLSRLPNEKEFAINSKRDGRRSRYAAA